MKTDPLIVPGLAAVAARYDAFVLDLWGCVHDGLKPYPGVPETLATLRRNGKRVLLLSNVPRRVGPVQEMLQRMGIGPELYDLILSSGESAWRALRLRSDAAHAGRGRVGFHHGPARDVNVSVDVKDSHGNLVVHADINMYVSPRKKST